MLAVLAGKLTAGTIRMLNAGLGSNLPGRVARKVTPAVLSSLAAQSKRGILAVTGTNGKSTTSGLLSSILEAAQLQIVHNRQGANLVTGITATLVEAATWNGKLACDLCLFEIDEAALPLVAKETPIHTIVVTNLFRDQLDRFGELDTTARLINKGIEVHNSLAVLNADDPNVSQLATKSKRIYFGIQSLAATDKPETTATTATSAIDLPTVELSYCSNCGHQISYKTTFYGQIGHWFCTACSFTRTSPSVTAREVTLFPDHSEFELVIFRDSSNTEIKKISLALPGLFNVYNALAATAAAFALNIELAAIEKGLANYKTLFGRSERFKLDGKDVIIQLIKNPAGASQTAAAAASDTRAKVLIAINDNLADGRDISWLWDADFEKLATEGRVVLVAGQRAEDMAVRMKYAGIKPENITCVPSLERAVKQALAEVRGDETLWILPTYTCLLELQKIMSNLGHRLSGT